MGRSLAVSQIALSRKDGAYLSHATAISLHKLTHQHERTIYVNAEQSPKPQSGSLTQDGIDRAFAREQRQSNLIYQYKNWTFAFLEDKNTARLGVVHRRGPSGELLEVTGLERTLIDIVVRPSYAGGISQVLAAYKAAKAKLAVDLLLKTLKNLDYLYPYHQAIGFYMQRAGYAEAQYSKLRKLSVEFDFYLAHHLADTAYDPYWHLYYPKELR
jgi:predicted transcriptional regulator of viral defense system